MRHATARDSRITTRRNAAIRALGLSPRGARVSAHIVHTGDRADVWEVTIADRRDIFCQHVEGRVSVGY
jgi:hypothetical protein